MIWGNTNRIYPVTTLTFYRCCLISAANAFKYQLQFSTLIHDFLFIGLLSPHLKCQNGFLFEVVLQPVNSFQYGAEESGFFSQMLLSRVEGVLWQGVCTKCSEEDTELRHSAGRVKVVGVCGFRALVFPSSINNSQRWNWVLVKEHMSVFVEA